KNGALQVRLAHCLAKTGGGAEAKQILGALVDEPPPTGLSALQELGDLALQSGDYNAAVEAFDKLLAKAPSNIDAKAALVDALKGWKRAPKIKEAQLALGTDAYEGGDLDEAEQRLKGATAIDANYQAAYYQLGLVYKERGDSDGARKAWSTAARINPRNEL